MTERELFFKYIGQTSPFPLQLQVDKAKGIYLYLKSGGRCIDLISGISVSSLGHCHPRVIGAVRHQLKKTMHQMVYGEFIESNQVQLAKRLTDTLPTVFDNAYFVNSGSEAIELAMKLAKKHSGRKSFISMKNSYHGSTQGALSLCGAEKLKKGFYPLLKSITHIEFNNLESIKKITEDTAALIMEPIQSEAGVIVSNKKYLQLVQKRCHEKGVLLIFDEIQTGWGRTGKFWSFEHFHIFPDIVVTAKAMGGGLPLGAVITSKEIMKSISQNPILGHITTFGGNPVSCAASLATLKVLQKENCKLMREVKKKHILFKKLLVHKKITASRMVGLHIALEFENQEIVEKIVPLALKKGVLVDWFLFNSKCIRIAPPLIISMPQIYKACRILLEVIEEVESN